MCGLGCVCVLGGVGVERERGVEGVSRVSITNDLICAGNGVERSLLCMCH